MSKRLPNEKGGQSPYVRSTHRAVPAGADQRLVGDCPLFPSLPIAAEFWPLLDAACADELTDDQTVELQTHLENNPAARRAYIAHIRLRTDIRQWWKGERARASGLSRIEADFEHPTAPAGVLSIDDAPSVGEAIEQPHTFFPTLSPLPSPTSPAFVGGPVFSYMVATLVLCAMLLSAWAYKITHVEELVQDNGKSSINSTNDPRYEVVGYVTGVKDCVWAKDSLATMGGATVPMGRKYELISGLMEINYTSGARVILEGPCEYTVDSDAGGRLQLGRLVARVEKRGEKREERGEKKVASGEWRVASAKPQAAKPESRIPNPESPASSPQPLFSVRTPTAIVTDLGTEFGVEVGNDGGTYSRVFHGSVKVRLIGDDRSSGVVLHENESANTKKMGIGKTMSLVMSNDADQSRFVRKIPSPIPVNSEAYAESVLSLDPVLYYRMERPDGERNQRLVRDSARGGNHGELSLGDEFGGQPYRAGRFGDAISLRGPDARDYVLVKDYPKARENRLTVAAWVMATGRPGWAMIAANWGHPTVKGQFHLGLCQRDGDLSVSISQSDGKQVDLREGSEQPFPLFNWQFVAFSADGDTLRLYRNGKLVASAACKGIYADTPLSGLGIGCRMNDDETVVVVAPPGYHYWQGRIDELAIFNQALSGERINQLFSGKQINITPDSTAARKGGGP